MNIPPGAHPIWRDLVTGRVKISFECVAVKILHGSLVRSYVKDPSADRLDRCAGSLREFFVQNAGQPAAKKDLEKICRQEVLG